MNETLSAFDALVLFGPVLAFIALIAIGFAIKEIKQ
jgi:hypothetical protein